VAEDGAGVGAVARLLVVGGEEFDGAGAEVDGAVAGGALGGGGSAADDGAADVDAAVEEGDVLPLQRDE
jgi:hypothetical protein